MRIYSYSKEFANRGALKEIICQTEVSLSLKMYVFEDKMIRY